MKRASTILAVIVTAFLLILTGPVAATTWYVDVGGSGDFLTIQDGIDASSNGDTVLVAAGTYYGPGNRNIDMLGKAIVLVSESGPAVTILDAGIYPGFPDRVFEISNGETSSTVIDGFTVTGASSIAIYIFRSDPTVQNCVITGNDSTATNDGGGIYLYDSVSKIDNCTISDNQKKTSGGGIYISHSDGVLLQDCLISGNSTQHYGGGVDIGNSGVYILGCTVTGNSTSDASGGINSGSYSYVVIEECLISGNTSGFRGGGLCTMGPAHLSHCDIIGNEGVWAGGIMADDDLVMENCTVAFNSSAVNGAGIYYNGATTFISNSIISHNNGQGINTIASPLAISCSDVYGNTDGNYTGGISDQTGINDNISVDPVFCDHAGGDYSIGSVSPCAPANSPCGGLIGRHDVGCIALPDLIVADVDIDDRLVEIGDSIQVTVKIKNIGNLAAEGFFTGLYFDLPSPPLPGMSGNIFFYTYDLAAGDSLVHVIPNISNTDLGDWDPWVQVDYTNAVTESDENNNVYEALRTWWSFATRDGWPATCGGPFYSSPAIALIDDDPRTKEVVIGCDDGYLYAWTADGNALPGWPIDLGSPISSSPAVGNIAGDFHNEIVVGCGAFLYAFDYEGTQLWRFGPSQPVTSTPALVDLDDDGMLEILFSRRSLILDVQLFALEGDGTLYPGSWPILLEGNNATSPAAGDMDHDGDIEIAVVSSGVDKLEDKSLVHLFSADGSYYSPFWPTLIDVIITCSPVLGNIASTDFLEIVTGGLDGTIYAINVLGNIWPTLPQVSGEINKSLALAELDSDDYQEIVAISRTTGVFCFCWLSVIDNDGTVSGPLQVGNWPGDLESPSVISFYQMAFGGSPDEYLFGRTIPFNVGVQGFPLAVEEPTHSSMAAGDLDGDGYLDLVVATSSGSVFAIDLGSDEDFEAASPLCWPFYRNDRTRCGCYFVETLTDAGEAEDILPTATALQSIHPNPFNPATTIAFDISKRTRVKLTVYDAAGRTVCVLKDEVMDRGRHEVVWNGKNSAGGSVATGVYFCRLSAGDIVQTEKMVLLR